MRPCPGLSVPVATVLSEAGEVLEREQRAVVRFVMQQGYGADVVFAAGTSGEWNRLSATKQRFVVQLCVEEVAKQNAALALARPVEAWAGVTAHTKTGTLENLEAALAVGADAAVLAPLSIRGIKDPVRFVAREVADLLDASPRRIPVYLYDNAEIAVDPKHAHIPTRQVKALSRLDFVRGVKVSGSRKVLGNYTRAAANFRERGAFGIYVGNALLIFDIFAPRQGLLGALIEHWQRRRMAGGLPVGVVAGPANALPREWARAWQVCRAGDVERMRDTKRVLEAFRQATRLVGGHHTIACLKRALLQRGVITSAAVAEGTPALSPAAAARFDKAFADVRALSTKTLAPIWATPVFAETEHAA